MGKWRDEPMNTGGAAAAPYQRAANDECRICGGEKRVFSLFAHRAFWLFFSRENFFSLNLSLGADHFLSLSLFVAFVRRHWSLVRGVKRAWKERFVVVVVVVVVCLLFLRAWKNLTNLITSGGKTTGGFATRSGEKASFLSKVVVAAKSWWPTCRRDLRSRRWCCCCWCCCPWRRRERREKREE